MSKEKKSRPILFSTDMVQAILANKKKQTRRVIKPPFEFAANGYLFKPIKNERFCPYPCPYGSVGDSLWVRETSYIHNTSKERIWATDWEPNRFEDGKLLSDVKTIPSIYMPREAARIFLIIKNIRVEKLQEITEEDAKAEGSPMYVAGHGTITREELESDPGYSNFISYKMGYEYLWDSINGKKYPWDSNPWVWVIEFERVNIA